MIEKLFELFLEHFSDYVDFLLMRSRLVPIHQPDGTREEEPFGGRKEKKVANPQMAIFGAISIAIGVAFQRAASRGLEEPNIFATVILALVMWGILGWFLFALLSRWMRPDFGILDFLSVVFQVISVGYVASSVVAFFSSVFFPSEGVLLISTVYASFMVVWVPLGLYFLLRQDAFIRLTFGRQVLLYLLSFLVFLVYYSFSLVYSATTENPPIAPLPSLNLWVGYASCELVLEDTKVGEPETDPETTPEATDQYMLPTPTPTDEPGSQYVVYTLGENCAGAQWGLWVPQNETLWLALFSSRYGNVERELPLVQRLQLDTPGDDPHPPQINTLRREFGCAFPEPGEQICRVLTEWEGETVLVEVPVFVADIEPVSTETPSLPEMTPTSGE